MKKSFLQRVIIIIVAFVIGRGVGYLVGSATSGGHTKPSSSPSLVPSASDLLKDSVVEHKVVKSELDDGISTYTVIFYGNDTHVLKDLYVEYVCDKEKGYTLEGVEQDTIKSYYPSFSEISFGESERYVVVTVKMKNLESKDRIKALVDKELIELTENEEADKLDADFLYNSYIEDGFVDAPYSDYEILDFSH